MCSFLSTYTPTHTQTCMHVHTPCFSKFCGAYFEYFHRRECFCTFMQWGLRFRRNAAPIGLGANRMLSLINCITNLQVTECMLCLRSSYGLKLSVHVFPIYRRATCNLFPFRLISIAMYFHVKDNSILYAYHCLYVPCMLFHERLYVYEKKCGNWGFHLTMEHWPSFYRWTFPRNFFVKMLGHLWMLFCLQNLWA